MNLAINSKTQSAVLFYSLLFLLALPSAFAQRPSRNNNPAPSATVPLSSITAPTANTSIATGTFSTTFTEGDFGSHPSSAHLESPTPPRLRRITQLTSP